MGLTSVLNDMEWGGVVKGAGLITAIVAACVFSAPTMIATVEMAVANAPAIGVILTDAITAIGAFAQTHGVGMTLAAAAIAGGFAGSTVPDHISLKGFSGRG